MKTLRDCFFGIFVLMLSAQSAMFDHWQSRSILPTSETLNSIIFANGAFTAIGTAGVILSSETGEIWDSLDSPTDASLSSIAYGNGAFIVVGNGDTILRSVDGKVWQKLDALPDGSFSAITYGNGLFVAAGYSTVASSPDGLSWTKHNPRMSGLFNRVAFGNGVFVAVSTDGGITTSPDGITWTGKFFSNRASLLGVAFGNNRFVISQLDFAHTQVLLYSSSDGVQWEPESSPLAGTGGGIFFLNDKFYCPGFMDSGATKPVLRTSPDGLSWTSAALNGNSGPMAFGNGLYLLAGITPLGVNVLTSVDAKTWVKRSLRLVSQPLSGVAAGAETFIAVGTGGLTFASNSGVTWTQHTSKRNSDLSDIIYAAGTFVTVGASGTIQKSTNGTDWILSTSGTKARLLSVCYGNGRFVAAGEGGTIVTSQDGNIWTLITPSPTTDHFMSICYGGGVFLAVVSSGNVFLSSDASTWTPGGRVPNSPRSCAFGNNLFVAVGNQPSVYTSSDGTNWVSHPSQANQTLVKALFARDSFIGLGTFGSLVTSPDGTNWTKRISRTSFNLDGAAYSADSLVVVGDNGLIMQSGAVLELKEESRLPDGTFTFTTAAHPDNALSIERSFDLLKWQEVTNSPPQSGVLHIHDEGMSQTPKVFYRAVLPGAPSF
jgi:hypothetical protein